MIRERDRLLALLRALHDDIARAVVAASEERGVEALAAVVADDDPSGDTIFALDRISEERLVAFFAERVAPIWPLVLVAEGLADVGQGAGVVALPVGLDPVDAELRIIVDPVDGTRGLMYQKRAAWVLTGVAPNRGDGTRLSDIELALQTEIPLAKQHLADQLWAARGAGVVAERRNRLTGERFPLRVRPSQAATIEQGFATVARFFPGMRDVLGALDEAIMRAALGPARRDKAQSFEDQYICTGGQLYELLAGHDRFVADLRPLMETALAADGRAFSICAHPYDLAALLVAQEAGIIVTDPRGQSLDAPLDTTTNVAWVAHANAAIRAQMEPPLHEALRARGLI
jgi:hypothetical protein